jgi:TM2 domain-containing membrane protein YozV
LPYCPKCGKEVTEEFNICPNCGNVLRSISPTSHVSIGTKNPGVGAVLSLLIAGLGQIYAGRIGRGLLIMFIAIPLTIIVAFLFFWLILPLFLPLAIWIWNIFDAYNICKKYNTLLTETEKSPW